MLRGVEGRAGRRCSPGPRPAARCAQHRGAAHTVCRNEYVCCPGPGQDQPFCAAPRASPARSRGCNELILDQIHLVLQPRDLLL